MKLSKIGVFITDDQTIVRRGIAMLLREQQDIEVLGEASDGWEAIENVHRCSPDVVLMDIGMPGISGLDTTRQLTSALPYVSVLMLTVHESEEYLFQSLKAGASGYLLKNAVVDDLLGAIRTVNSGEVFIYPRMATKLVSEYLRFEQQVPIGDTYARLSIREREVLPMLAESQSNREIGDRLHLSPHTVQTYHQRIMRKLDIHNRSELMRYALRKGLIRLDP